MDYITDLIFDFFTLSLYAILIIVAVCIILRNARKVYCIIYEISDISFKGFFTALLALFFRQLSTIIIYSMIGTVAQLYLKRSMLFGIGFFFTESASLLRGMGVRFPSVLLILTVVISAVISIVKHLREGEIKRYMPLYVIGIVAISCVCTVALCHIMPPGIDSLIGMFHSGNPFWGAFVVAGTVFILTEEPLGVNKQKKEQKEGDTP